MGTQEIVQKLWNLCNVLRDDGITYHQYVTELTYILFLKMMKETGQEDKIPAKFRWDVLVSKNGIELKNFYKLLLLELGTKGEGKVKIIYNNAQTSIDEPKNLEKVIKEIDKIDWYSAKEEGLGDLYEGLLEKNANEKKSGAGQYFTPRPLINVMVRVIDPKIAEKCNDPACGTFGFMIASDRYLKAKYNDYMNLSEEEIKIQKYEAFTGCELVSDTHRLALMNAMLHDIDGEIKLADTLSGLGKSMSGYDVVLTNPPFGTKKGGERPSRDDLTFLTSNKQLNFLQHIYRSLNKDGKSRAAVVVPDNVLFQDGDGQRIREDLLNKCNLHTILRLPTGIFYAQGVKTNVMFFTRGTTEKDNTKEVAFYDMRTNMENLGKTNPLTEKHFEEFESTVNSSKEEKQKIERWSVFTIQEIKAKNFNLDLGLIRDDSVISHEDLPDPVESAEMAIGKLEEAIDLISEVARELKILSANKAVE
ncbi:MAG: SAM-dependent methyltransferase [Spirochaetes bacterium GWD1_27_9]|nr:MAG: SAM-dependent methyltransferase [Spirochaetes bacterium GWB1_27_13]OHD27718.1 MAG: SAM-dependent methyltransferase [Spirochaetes bacterium GWC1_27_15]OHD43679.1 MAG: SAM-dependent methyltransferase [Spirochaetes bacterium GWD1_27_9]